MAKNKISGISDTLAAQAKERFNPVDEVEIKDNSEAVYKTTEKVRKNFYIEKYLTKLLRKMAYEEETDQTKIVNAALEAYFKEHKYIE